MLSCWRIVCKMVVVVLLLLLLLWLFCFVVVVVVYVLEISWSLLPSLYVRCLASGLAEKLKCRPPEFIVLSMSPGVGCSSNVLGVV